MLFAKNKPTKKEIFGDDYVILRHLSKGELDEYKARLAELSAQLQTIGKENIDKMGNGDITAVPESMGDIMKSIQSLEIYKVTTSIVKWSVEEDVNEENVKALDEEVFNKLSAAVDEMNKLKELERKN
jgi:division protein CdvB (Snf7/Vps24/ESCRT-III family)